MGKDLAKAMAGIPAIQLLEEKYGPMASWPKPSANAAGSSMPASSPTCRSCRDQGWILRPYENPNASLPNQRAIPCPDCGEGEAARIAQAERVWAVSGISAEERARCTFARFRLDQNPPMAAAWHAARRWSTGDGPPFLVLSGSTRGLGKTHLAIAAGGACITRGLHVTYAVVPRFLDRLRATYGQESTEGLLAVRGEAEAADALVLDDLGASKATEWANEQLFTVLDWRWSRSLRTLITSNLRPTELEERVASRICDRSLSLVIACSGNDYRLRGQS